MGGQPKQNPGDNSKTQPSVTDLNGKGKLIYIFKKTAGVQMQYNKKIG